MQRKGVDINRETRGGNTALIVAARDNRGEVVRLLLQNGADVRHKSRDSGMTAMDVAQVKAGVVPKSHHHSMYDGMLGLCFIQIFMLHVVFPWIFHLMPGFEGRSACVNLHNTYS